jgi:hypothetical protein
MLVMRSMTATGTRADSPRREGSQRSEAGRSLPAAAAWQRDLVDRIDEPVVQRTRGDAPGQRSEHAPPNDSGLPDRLRSGIEALSGVSMAGVRVHHNSSGPAALRALAYTQGNDIHLGPGQARHLPHEAWHVVQQRQGRVAATRQLKSGVALNDDAGLEREADVMGARALTTAHAAEAVETRPAPTAEVAQCYHVDVQNGYRTSEEYEFGVSVNNRQSLFATQAAVTASNEKLAAVGSLILLQCVGDIFSGYYDVVPVINPAAVKAALWTRMAARQPEQGFRTFSDCARTGTAVAGMDQEKARPDVMVLDLPTGQVDVIPDKDKIKYNTPNMAARVALSFFMDVLPKFKLTFNGIDDLTVKQQAIINAIDVFTAAKDGDKLEASRKAYRAILADAEAKTRFGTTYGVNGGLAPQVGSALVQYNDPVEKAAAQTDKWNFHWAGVVMVDGADYLSLENCAVELQDSTAEEFLENDDAFDFTPEPFDYSVKNPKYSKRDMLNNRWYFKLYGSGDQSFHDEMLTSPYSTASPISMPTRKKV